MGHKRSSDHIPNSNKKRVSFAKVLHATTQSNAQALLSQTHPLTQLCTIPTQSTQPQPQSQPQQRTCTGKQIKSTLEAFVLKDSKYIFGMDAAGEGIMIGKLSKGRLQCFGDLTCVPLVTKKQTHCANCAKLCKTVRARYQRAKKSGKYHPRHVQHISAAEREYIEGLRQTIHTLQTAHQRCREKLEELQKLNDMFQAKVILEDNESESLVKLLIKVLAQNKTFNSECFLYKFIRQQLVCLDLGNVRSFRWDPVIVHWAMTLQYHGGEYVIDSIRGKSTQGLGQHGKLIVHPEDWGLFIPSSSTMRHYLPYIKLYEELSIEKVTKIKTQMGALDVPVVGWCGDEMEIRAGLTYLKAMGIVVGSVTGPIAEKEVRNVDTNSIPKLLAAKIMMVHIVSTDGKIALPLIHYATTSTSATGSWLAKKIIHLATLLEQGDIKLHLWWGSTDGWYGSADFIAEMRKIIPHYCHFFDFTHVVKNMRNLLLLHYIWLKNDPNTMFAMKTVWLEYKGKKPTAPDVHMVDTIPENYMSPPPPDFEPYDSDSDDAAALPDQITITSDEIDELDRTITPSHTYLDTPITTLTNVLTTHLSDTTTLNTSDLVPTNAPNIVPISSNTTMVSSDMASTSSDMAPISSDIAPISSDIAPISSDIAPISSNMASVSSNMASVSFGMASVSSGMASVSSSMASVSSGMAPVSSGMASVSSGMASVSSSMASVSSDMAPVSSSMATISSNIVSQTWKTSLKQEDIYPTDKMDIDPVLKITSNEVVSHLLSSSDKATRLVGQYLQRIREYYDLWMNNKLDIQTKIQKLKDIVSYFKTVHTHKSEILKHIVESVNSLESLVNHLGEKYSWKLQGTSWLSTLITENYFSVIRAKVRYPNYWEFCYVARRAKNELIKAHATNYGFPVRAKRLGKKYANVEGVQFKISDIELNTRAQKCQQQQHLLQLNGGTPDDKKAAKALADQYPCSSKRLLIREATCKTNPLVLNKLVTSRLVLHCSVPKCTMYYVVKGHLTNHLQTSHKFTKENAQAKSLEIEAQAMKDAVLGEDFNGTIHLVLFDLETTGLIHRDEPFPHIIEIAAHHFNGVDRFSSLVNPPMAEVPKSATKINHLTKDMLITSPTFEVIGEQFVKWVSSFSCPQDIVIFIAHNCERFDKPILLASMESMGISVPSNWRFGDSLKMFRKVLPKLGPPKSHPYRLENIYKHLHGTTPSNIHRADGDAATLYKCLLSVFKATTLADVEEKVINALLSR